MKNKSNNEIKIPPMNGEQAFLVAELLDQVVSAIWHTHGDAMSNFQGRALPDWPSARPDFYTYPDNNPHGFERDDIPY